MSAQEEKGPESVSRVSAGKQYRVSWKSKETGCEGHGEWFDDVALVSFAVKEGNKDSMIDH